MPSISPLPVPEFDRGGRDSPPDASIHIDPLPFTDINYLTPEFRFHQVLIQTGGKLLFGMPKTGRA